MQIKKGPYGYYAIKKFDDPDILCTYAEEVIDGNISDFYLKPDTEYLGSGIMCCFEFSGFMQITDPEFSVFSPGKKNIPHKKNIKNLSMRRRSAGDLFYSFIKLLDHLISPSCIVLDPDMVFADPDGITVKLCCLPVKSMPDELCLSSLNAERLERLLNCDFFKSVLTSDEINALVYSVRENNEELFVKTACKIRGSEEENEDPLPFLNTGAKKIKHDKKHAGRKYTKEEKDLMIACLSSFLSFVLMAGKMLFPCFLFFFLALVILTVAILNRKKRELSVHKEESQKIAKQRSSILFSESPSADTKITSSEEERTGESGTFQPLITGQLSLISEIKGVNPQYSLYLDETCIGSDCFLSDIVIDDPHVAPLHAVIKQVNGSFYLEPSKGTGKTYLEDSPVENGRSYEIKSGQKITVGNIEFRFATERLAKNTY